MLRRVVNSSSIASVGYEAARQDLEVEFVQGEVYAYRGVPLHVYRALMQATTKGAYFNDNIRDRFDAKRVR